MWWPPAISSMFISRILSGSPRFPGYTLSPALRKIPRGISEDHRGAIVAVQHSICELAFVEVDVGQFNHVWPRCANGIGLRFCLFSNTPRTDHHETMITVNNGYRSKSEESKQNKHACCCMHKINVCIYIYTHRIL